jgi:hypothetical protein
MILTITNLATQQNSLTGAAYQELEASGKDGGGKSLEIFLINYNGAAPLALGDRLKVTVRTAQEDLA